MSRQPQKGYCVDCRAPIPPDQRSGWSPYWCRTHDEERRARITAFFDRMATGEGGWAPHRKEGVQGDG